MNMTNIDAPRVPKGAVKMIFISAGCILFLAWALGSATKEALKQPVKSAQEANERAERQRQPSDAPAPPSPMQPALTPAEHLAAAKQMLKAKLANGYQVGQAESHLNAIKNSDPEYKESRDLLKTVKAEEQRLIKELAQTLRKRVVAGREQWADEMERGMLRKGFDVHITLSGADKTVMTMQYVLLSRPTVYQLQEGDFFYTMKKRGFKKAILTDGYGRSWTFDLTK